MAETNLRSFGSRYGAANEAPKSGASAPEAVLEFIIYLHNLIRDDAAMVAQLDRAVKGRYGDR